MRSAIASPESPPGALALGLLAAPLAAPLRLFTHAFFLPLHTWRHIPGSLPRLRCALIRCLCTIFGFLGASPRIVGPLFRPILGLIRALPPTFPCLCSALLRSFTSLAGPLSSVFCAALGPHGTLSGTLLRPLLLRRSGSILGLLSMCRRTALSLPPRRCRETQTH